MLDALSRGLTGSCFCIRDSIVWICAYLHCGQILASSLLSMEAIVTVIATVIWNIQYQKGREIGNGERLHAMPVCVVLSLHVLWSVCMCVIG